MAQKRHRKFTSTLVGHQVLRGLQRHMPSSFVHLRLNHVQLHVGILTYESQKLQQMRFIKYILTYKVHRFKKKTIKITSAFVSFIQNDPYGRCTLQRKSFSVTYSTAQPTVQAHYYTARGFWEKTELGVFKVCHSTILVHQHPYKYALNGGLRNQKLMFTNEHNSFCKQFVIAFVVLIVFHHIRACGTSRAAYTTSNATAPNTHWIFHKRKIMQVLDVQTEITLCQTLMQWLIIKISSKVIHSPCDESAFRAQDPHNEFNNKNVFCQQQIPFCW